MPTAIVRIELGTRGWRAPNGLSIAMESPVTYLRMIAADTIEEAIVGALERKSCMVKSLLGDEAGPAAISQLSRDEMCALLLRNELPLGPSS